MSGPVVFDSVRDYIMWLMFAISAIFVDSLWKFMAGTNVLKSICCRRLHTLVSVAWRIIDIFLNMILVFAVLGDHSATVWLNRTNERNTYYALQQTAIVDIRTTQKRVRQDRELRHLTF